MKDFDYWVNKFTPMIHSIIKNLNIYKDHDEYFHCGIHGLYEAYRLYKPGKTSFSTFAYPYIRGRILNQLRKNIDREEREVHVEDDIFVYLLQTREKNPVEKKFFIKQGVEHLKADLREIIILHYFNGFSLKEIAEKMNMSYPTVKRKHKEALQKLRIYLDS